MVGDPTFQQQLLNRSQGPGVLGLTLPRTLAEHLFERLTQVGVEGSCFPALYHHPRISQRQAEILAAPLIEK